MSAFNLWTGQIIFTACLSLLATASAAAEPAALWFRSGFENGVAVAVRPGEPDRLTGSDGHPRSDWSSDLPAARVHFVYLVGSRPVQDYARSSIVEVPDRHGRPTRALRMDSLQWDRGNRPGLLNRNEYSLFEPGYHQAYARYQMRLQPDYAALCPSDDITSWRMFFEIKEPDSGVKRIEGADNRRTGTNNYRISFYIRRKADGRFYWHVRGESPQPVRTVDWDLFNDEVPVPLDRWFQVEVGFNHAPAPDGFVWLAIDGRQVALHRGRTQHPTAPLPLRFWSPFKLYASRDWLEAGPLSQWIDDVEFWSAIPDDASPRDETLVNRSTFIPPIAESTTASSPSPALTK